MSQKEKKEVIYFSKAEKTSIANFVPEKKTGGVIDQVEKPLDFVNHLCVCDMSTSEGKKKAKHIESCDSFKSGLITKHDSFESAHVELNKLLVQKQKTQINIDVPMEDNSSISPDVSVAEISSVNM